MKDFPIQLNAPTRPTPPAQDEGIFKSTVLPLLIIGGTIFLIMAVNDWQGGKEKDDDDRPRKKEKKGKKIKAIKRKKKLPRVEGPTSSQANSLASKTYRKYSRTVPPGEVEYLPPEKPSSGLYKKTRR